MDMFTLKRLVGNQPAMCALAVDRAWGAPLEPPRCAPTWWFLFNHFEMGDAYGGRTSTRQEMITSLPTGTNSTTSVWYGNTLLPLLRHGVTGWDGSTYAIA